MTTTMTIDNAVVSMPMQDLSNIAASNTPSNAANQAVNSPNAVVSNEECGVAWGKCNHAFHLHCISRWLKSRNVCPLDNSKWEFQKYANNNKYQCLRHKYQCLRYKYQCLRFFVDFALTFFLFLCIGTDMVSDDERANSPLSVNKSQ